MSCTYSTNLNYKRIINEVIAFERAYMFSSYQPRAYILGGGFAMFSAPQMAWFINRDIP